MKLNQISINGQLYDIQDKSLKDIIILNEGGGLTVKNGNYDIINQLDKLITIGNKNCNIDIVGENITINGKEIGYDFIKYDDRGNIIISKENNTIASMATKSTCFGKNNTIYGNNNFVEGDENLSGGDNTHVEGYKNDAGTVSSNFAHIEGYNNSISRGNGSRNQIHIEGDNNQAKNESEHAQGSWNLSNSGSELKDKTKFSIGIGSSEKRMNAVEVMANGDVYIRGIGDYDGTNYSSAKTLQKVINEILNK